MSVTENDLVEAMSQAAFYPHPAAQVKRIETHISWIFLTGEYAYKVKKPVNFGFLDFSSLEKRKYFCEQELRLNRRLAPKLYLEVLPIRRDSTGYHLEGQGAVVEYCLRMKQFDQGCLLDRLLERGQIDERDMLDLADTIAHFHATIARAPTDSPLGDSETIWQAMAENFAALEAHLPDRHQQARLRRLHQRVQIRHQKLVPHFAQRRQEGFIRECHGDLHLGNIARIGGHLTLFDGIEFNDEFRWIDVMSDLAFLLMDLREHGHQHFAWLILNRYLEISGDYAGLAVLAYYQCYRALVRAKVAALRMTQQAGGERARSLEQLRQYLELAEAFVDTSQQPWLLITHGLSGSGKSWLAARLATRLGAIRIRSDVERKRLFQLAPEASSQQAGIFIYDADSNEQTYQRLLALAEQVIQAGYPVIADATFLQTSRRADFQRLADSLHCPFVILDCQAPRATLEQRLRQRQGDASEADIEVLQRQWRHYRPLSGSEQAMALRVDTGEGVDPDRLVQQLRQALFGKR